MANLKPGWRRVKFGDVVRLHKETCKNPTAEGIDRYIGLEHLEPGELRIRSWGDVSDGTTFTSRVRPGQVLFGKRRAYQRKVAVADFDAVCSGDIYVFESANPERLLPDLLPFLCQTDSFFEHAVGTSAGSLSPRTNWTSLAEYEFALPPMEEQRRLTDLFVKVENVINERSRLSRVSGVLVKSAVDACFDGSLCRTNERRVHTELGFFPRSWRIVTLCEVTTKIVDGVHKRPNYVDAGIPFLTVENLTRGPGVDFEQTRFITWADHVEFSKRAPTSPGDVLVSKDGTLGVARVVETDREFSIFVSLALLKPQRGVLDPWFLRYYFDSRLFLRRLGTKTSGSALKHIHLVDLRNTSIPLPTYNQQLAFVEVIRSAENSMLLALDGKARAQRLKENFLRTLVLGYV